MVFFLFVVCFLCSLDGVSASSLKGHCLGKGVSFSAALTGIFWDVYRVVDVPLEKEFGTASGKSLQSLRKAAGTFALEKSFLRIDICDVFVRVRTQVSSVQWTMQEDIVRNFQVGEKLNEYVREKAFWGSVEEEFHVKPFHSWDILTGVRMPCEFMELSMGAGMRFLSLSTQTTALEAKGDASVKLSGALKVTTKYALCFAVLEGGVNLFFGKSRSWALTISGAFLVPRTIQFDLDKRPHIIANANTGKPAFGATRFGTLRLGGGELCVGCSLTI